jgi:hypothetical protein
MDDALKQKLALAEKQFNPSCLKSWSLLVLSLALLAILTDLVKVAQVGLGNADIVVIACSVVAAIALTLGIEKAFPGRM